MNSGYTFEDILKAYEKAGVSPGAVVLVRGNLGNLFNYVELDKVAVLQAHYDALWKLLGPQGTLVVPTNTLSLCNTDTHFNLHTTPSWQMGAFSEFVRTKKESRRSRHPFVSYAVIGKYAEDLTFNVSRHGYGPNSVKDRMIRLKTHCLSVGMPPNLTCSTVHQAEQMMSVPYRYTKEFMHPIEDTDHTVTIEPFYLNVCYLESGLHRNKNKKIFSNFSIAYPVQEAPLGKGKVWGYDMADFFTSCLDSMADDIYIWLENPPEKRPFRPRGT